MNSIEEVSRERENQINAAKALNGNFIASLEKMEQAMLNLSKNLAQMNKRYESVMQARECDCILNNIM